MPEGQHLDYKPLLPDRRDESKKTEFLVDIVAFANGGGGDLVFGVAADSSTAKATSIDGLAGFSGFDAFVMSALRLISGETPVNMRREAFYVLHVVPLRAMTNGTSVDVVRLKESNLLPRPPGSGGW